MHYSKNTIVIYVSAKNHHFLSCVSAVNLNGTKKLLQYKTFFNWYDSIKY